MKSPGKTLTNLDAKVAQTHKAKALGARRGTGRIDTRRQKVKTLEQIQHEGGIHNFFECPYDV